MGEAKRKEKNIRIEVLLQEADELEKQISAGLAQKGIRAELTPQVRSWKEIQQKLQANEALVEMTRIRYYDKSFTDSVMYVALVVKKNSVYPEMVVFADGKVLEKQKDNYRNRYIINKRSKEDKKSYKIFYEPLKKTLSGIEKIYFCSDGVYHQINLNTLYNPETGKYLMDEIEVQYVSTARDFIELSKKSLKENLSSYQVHLFGYPDYSGGQQVSPSEGANQEERSLAQSLRSRMNENNQRFYNSTIESVALLPGTKIEVEKIYSIVKKNGMQCKMYLGLEASEENLKSLSGVNILHIATHGFFFSGNSSKKEEYDNPLNRSGLLLAGAEVSFKGGVYGKENGIVLSNEVMNLNLNGTDLVVLSACETGLGDVQSGEGVFGLQRSFQEAGARNVVMSLWTVDDESTQRLMVEFYEELLNKKVSSRQALKNSIQRIRQSYPEPYYWGAFVIIGE
jgi:CHAT domain-containing protein